MRPTLLTDAQRRTFEENGYLIVPNALDTSEIDQLLETGDRLMDGFEFHDYYAHRRSGLVQEQPFLDLVTNEQTVPIMVQLLNANIHITNTALIYKHPQPPEQPDHCNWHRDVGVSLDIGHGGLPRVGLKIGYCLTDFPQPNSGATMFVQGSNNLKTALPIRKGELHPDDYDQPILRTGDAFLFESRTYHAPAFNFTDYIAKVVIYGYHFRWIRPDHYMRFYNGVRQPDADLLNRTDDIGHQLLGATVDSQGREAPDGIDWPIREWAKQHHIPVTAYEHTVTE
jgi:ectoine hydroxylase-related dioxygenase (phytanoyl-CoA dioxygenase family)